AGAVVPAVEVALLRGAADLLPAGRAIHRPTARRQRLEDRIEPLDGRLGPADHQAVAALETPHAAAGSGVDGVDPAPGQRLPAPDVVDVVRVAAVDDRVTLGELGPELLERRVDHAGRHHEPHGTGCLEAGDEVVEGGRPGRLLLGEGLDRLRVVVVHHALVAVLDEPAHHVGAPPTQTGHSQVPAPVSLSAL